MTDEKTETVTFIDFETDQEYSFETTEAQRDILDELYNANLFRNGIYWKID